MLSTVSFRFTFYNWGKVFRGYLPSHCNSCTSFSKWICFVCEPNPIKVPSKNLLVEIWLSLLEIVQVLSYLFFASSPFLLECRYLKLFLFKSRQTVRSLTCFIQALDLIRLAVNDLISFLSLKSVLRNIRSCCLDNLFRRPGLLFLWSCIT